MARQVARRTGVPALRHLVTALLAGRAGCGPSGADKLYPVEGQVKFGGRALTHGTVILHPDAGQGNASQHEPRGDIGPDGHYRIFTHPDEGAPAGWYKVTVVATEPSDPKNPYSLPRSLIPEKFGKPDESRLTFEVRKDPPPGAYDLDLK